MSDHQPRRGDKFYDQNIIGDGQPNGKIINVDWEGREVTVQFLDAHKTWKTYDFEDIENYYYPESFGGIYMLPKIVPRTKTVKTE